MFLINRNKYYKIFYLLYRFKVLFFSFFTFKTLSNP